MSRRAAGPETLECRTAVRASLADLESGSTVLVACSGGPDSLALTAAAAWVGSRLGLDVRAIVVDHGLQPDSADVAVAAAQACDALGAPATVVRVVVGTAGGPEAAAREARYAALRQAAQESDAATVLLGHTLEDQAETVLLRLARGSGARSLAAMAPVDDLWRRPLLRLSRETVRRAATEALEPVGLQAWSDPHNGDPSFARVRVRTVMPELEAAVGGGAVLGLARTADLLRDDANLLDALARDARERIVDTQDGVRGAACADLAALHPALRSRILRAMIIEAGAPAESVGIDHVRTVDAFITQWHGQGEARLPGGVRADRSCGRLRLQSSDPDGSISGGA